MATTNETCAIDIGIDTNTDSENEKLCLENFYAVGILESIGIIDPAQAVIDEVEHLLLNVQSHTDPVLSYLLSSEKKPRYRERQKALLVEHSPLLAVSHAILLNNLGFEVDVAKNTREAVLKPVEQYAAAFLRDSLPENNAFFLMCFIQKTIPFWKRPLVFNFCSKKQMCIEHHDYLKTFGSKASLRLPVMPSTLLNEVQKAGLLAENFFKKVG